MPDPRSKSRESKKGQTCVGSLARNKRGARETNRSGRRSGHRAIASARPRPRPGSRRPARRDPRPNRDRNSACRAVLRPKAPTPPGRRRLISRQGLRTARRESRSAGIRRSRCTRRQLGAPPPDGRGKRVFLRQHPLSPPGRRRPLPSGRGARSLRRPCVRGRQSRRPRRRRVRGGRAGGAPRA